MTNHQFVTVSRTLLKRGATDIERKLAAAMTSGAATYVVLGILTAYGVKIPAQVAEALPLIFAGIGGWMAHSVGATTHTVVTEPDGRRVESTTTGAVPIQSTRVPSAVPRGTVAATPAPQQVPAQEPTPAWTPPAEEPVTHEVPDSTESTPDSNATQVLPGSVSNRASAFLASLSSETNGH